MTHNVTFSFNNAKDSLKQEAESLLEDIRKERRKFNDVSITDSLKTIQDVEIEDVCSRRILTTPGKKMLDCCWGSDNKHVLVAQDESGVSLWDAYSSLKEAVFATEETWVCTCSISPNMHFICYGGNSGNCYVAAIPPMMKSNKQTKVVENSVFVGAHEMLITTCSFLGSEHQVVTSGADGIICLWDVESSSEICRLSGHTGSVLKFSFSPVDKSRTIATAGTDKTVRIWDLRSNKYTQVFSDHNHDVNTVKFLKTGDSVISGSDDGKCKFFDLRSDKLFGVYQKNSVIFGVHDLDLSPSCRLLFSGHHDGTINTWDTLKFSRLKTTYAHEERISSLTTSPDGISFATSSWDSTVKIWS